ncbi:oligosaccharide flippase family protein [Smaragdicoccus niigatensis]|uniref:oligosaccharide flippase family protein n=1 Tax=Smaragdicoccus niigatensis TaxID=359359 RepID=UPI00138AF783|nr:oligosaccharide flippase family protein [Smaragdicoccus niigatensis]
MSRALTLARQDSPVLVIGANLIAAGLGVLAVPVIARALGPSGRGETAAGNTLVYLLAVVLAIGLPLEIARLAARGKTAEALRSARVIALVGFVPATGFAAIAYWTIFSDFEPTARLACAAGVALCPLSVSWMVDSSVLIAQKRFRALFVQRVSNAATFLAAVVFLWITGTATTATVMLASIASSAVMCVLGLMFTWTSPRGPHMEFGTILPPSLRMAGGNVADAALNRLDQVLIVPLLGVHDAGLYSIGLAFGVVPLAIGQALGGAYFADMANAEGDARAELKAEAGRVGLAVAAVTTPLLILTAIVLVPIAFGREFEAAVVPTVIYLVGGAAMLASVPCSVTLVAEGRGHVITAAQTLGLATNVVLLLLMSGPFGLVGASIAAAIAFGVVLVVFLTRLRVPFESLVPRPRDVVTGFRRLARA